MDSVVWCGYTHKTLVLRSTHIMYPGENLKLMTAFLVNVSPSASFVVSAFELCFFVFKLCLFALSGRWSRAALVCEVVSQLWRLFPLFLHSVS